MRETGWVGRAVTAARIERAPATRPPAPALVALAVAASVVAGVGADALLVVAGTAAWPSTSGYAHFRFGDYAALTAIGVVAAGLAWPAVARISSEPRRLLGRLAVAVSAVLLLPDVWLLVHGQPADAVVVLAAMHVAVAVITYNLLVGLAPTGPAPAGATPGEARSGEASSGEASSAAAARLPAPGAARAGLAPWWVMVGLVAVVSVLGVAALVAVPVGRPDGWVPSTGAGVYLAHAAVGGVLGVGAAALVLVHLRGDRLQLHAAVAGLAGTAVGGAGGLLSVDEADRLAAMGLMLLGALVAVTAYLTPIGFADDPALPPGAGGASWATGPANPDGDDDRRDDDRRDELACTQRHRSSRRGRSDRRPLRTGPDAGLDAEGRAAECLAARTCPLCPGRHLRPIGSEWICGCCETVYRPLPDDGDGPAWSAAPGRRVARR